MVRVVTLTGGYRVTVEIGSAADVLRKSAHADATTVTQSDGTVTSVDAIPSPVA